MADELQPFQVLDTVIAVSIWTAHGFVKQSAFLVVAYGFDIAACLAVAVLLFAYRNGDANMRSVWLCTRNDAIGNVAVLLAALGVFGTGSGWPDILVASIMGMLGVTAAKAVVAQARNEMRAARPAVQPIADGYKG